MKFLILCFFLAATLTAQESGKLNNGLEYHLLHNETPQGRASVWLILKVGIIHENENQKGFAHLVEHLSWRGTKNISEQQMEEELSLLGITEEPEHISSVSEMDATVLRMNIALEHPRALEKAVFMLKEITSSAMLLPEAIGDEKKEVVEEVD